MREAGKDKRKSCLDCFDTADEYVEWRRTIISSGIELGIQGQKVDIPNFEENLLQNHCEVLTLGRIGYEKGDKSEVRDKKCAKVTIFCPCLNRVPGG